MQADWWELHCSSFVRQKTNPKMTAGRLFPIHHLLILWEWKKKVVVINQKTPGGEVIRLPKTGSGQCTRAMHFSKI